MPLGTLDRTPPPFFRQGASARTKLIFFAALALFLMVADGRFRFSTPLRETIALVLSPVQRVLRLPVELVAEGGGYLQGLQQALQDQQTAGRELVAQAERAARAERLADENAQLRGLLELKPALTVRSIAAPVLYEASDPYSRKLFIGLGSTSGARAGSPVINHLGVLGQVTRVYALSSEVTLLADKDAAIPVLNQRTQLRSAAFGGIQGVAGASMELRFTSPTADVQVGDLLQTSGLDGVYPPALPVARVVQVERRNDSSFARVLLAPVASADAVRHVLVLEPIGLQMPPRPEPAPQETMAEAASAAKAARAKPAAAASRVSP
jgi:rod shape-determining protein MreC